MRLLELAATREGARARSYIEKQHRQAERQHGSSATHRRREQSAPALVPHISDRRRRARPDLTDSGVLDADPAPLVRPQKKLLFAVKPKGSDPISAGFTSGGDRRADGG